MGLEIRLRHALGERRLELPPRPAEAPVVVGRASDADVQVPSVNVAPRHAVLFVHEGRWVLQDAGSESGTFVNRQKIEGPTFLQVGDVIALGTEPKRPKIEIDPNGGAAGRTGYVTAETTDRHVSRPAVPPPVSPAAGPYGYPSAPAPAYPQSYAAPAYPHPHGYAPPAPDPYAPPAYAPALVAPAEPDEWAGLAAAASTAVRSYHRPPRQSSGVGFVVGTLATVAVLGGGGWLLYKRMNQPTQVVVIQQGSTPVALPATQPAAATRPTSAPAGRGVFEFGGLPTATAPRPTLQDPTDQLDRPPGNVASEFNENTRPAPMTKPAEDGGASPQNAVATSTKPPAETPPENDPAWKSVEGAYYGRDPALAVLQFDAYAEANPGKMARTLATYTNDMADQIWWERIDQLLDHRKAVRAQLAKVDQEIKEETNASYKANTLGPERQKLLDQLNRIQAELNEMNWTSDNPPPLFDKEELARYARDRDAKYYEEWKAKVLRHIRRTHGQYPWANEK